VELLAHGDRVAVAVTSPSDRWRVPPVECPEPTADHGRGLYLMRHLADSVRIEQGRRGTTVYLIRRLRYAEAG
jgi:anti-sigma regulatory factor (Ser/Thr protein kinase)